jgi:hypothetical protein
MTSGTRVARSERSERLFRLWTLPLNEASKVLVTLTSAVPFTHFLIIGRLRSFSSEASHVNTSLLLRHNER